LAEVLEITQSEVLDTIRISSRHVSVDAPLPNSEDGGTMLELMPDDGKQTPDKPLMWDSLKIEIKKALSTLTPREAEILTLFYGLDDQMPLSLDEIGTKLDLTRERVRQLREKAIRRLRQTSRSTALKSFLG
jgi:RNA polymerase primary sigma factor